MNRPPAPPGSSPDTGAADTAGNAPRESARAWAVRALTLQAERFPDLAPPDDDTTGLSPADAALALAIYRTTVQRWLTLEHLIERFLPRKLRRLEPGMQAVLLSAGAQLIFMDRLPGYAVVDQAVSLSRKFVRPQAAGMVNAVLRKLVRLAEQPDGQAPWQPAVDRLPRMPEGDAGQGGVLMVPLAEPCLPEPHDIVRHLAAATSVPRVLVQRWVEVFGEPEAMRLCLHTIKNPPTVVAVEQGFDQSAGHEDWIAHKRAGAVVWRGKREALIDFLNGHPDRRVQDAASIASCEATSGLSPRTILDYCAGRGTKSRQLALMHPQATVYATDIHPGRRAQLREAAQGIENLQVIEPDDAGTRGYDLIVLDVPCTNTGVLARRPEARYRYSQQTVGSLVQLQRQIVDQASPWVCSGGHLLYCTCSIEKSENDKQADRIARKLGGKLISQATILPGGARDSYTDGSYHALMQMPHASQAG